MWSTLCVLVFLQYFVLYRTAELRGVAQEDSSKYANTLRCDQNSRKLSPSQINDNFCDCKDGFDEPGTSACSNGVFYCENERSLPKTIFSSRVDDGICDCCDGTDESLSARPGFRCANTCDEEGELLKRELRKQTSVMEQSILASRAKISEFRFITDTCDNRELNAIEMQQATKKLARLKKKFVLDEKNIKEATEEFKKKNDGYFSFLAKEPEKKDLDKILTVKFNKDPTAAKLLKEISQLNEAVEMNVKVCPQFEKLNLLHAEYYPLLGQVLEKESGDYIYKIEHFNKISQNKTVIGRWSGLWDSDLTAVYPHGDKCWDGPERKATIEFVCSLGTGIVNIKEPGYGEYVFVVETPAACLESHLIEQREKISKLGHQHDFF